ncbi:DUF2088 domain-containing protein, partial [bacterium]|nr:DUF2088 domain-containing protein [bacterium]
MVNGKGFPDRFLTESEIQAICADVLESAIRGDDKVLFVLPDHTRSAPIDVMFRTIYGKLCDYSEHVDFLIALGTHPPMTDAMIDARVGITGEERRTRFPKARFFNHRWNDPDSLISLGTLSETDVGRLSGGRLSCSVDVTINKMVLDYDRIVIVGPVFPHEVVGFSGGSKYLFPGIAGAEIIDMFH